jgi:hypothetical protein
MDVRLSVVFCMCPTLWCVCMRGVCCRAVLSFHEKRKTGATVKCAPYRRQSVQCEPNCGAKMLIPSICVIPLSSQTLMLSEHIMDRVVDMKLLKNLLLCCIAETGKIANHV